MLICCCCTQSCNQCASHSLVYVVEDTRASAPCVCMHAHDRQQGERKPHLSLPRGRLESWLVLLMLSVGCAAVVVVLEAMEGLCVRRARFGGKILFRFGT